MRVLQLCPKPPRPAIDGGCIAIDNITKGLIDQGHDVKVLTVFTHKHPYVAEAMSEEYKRLTRIEGVFVDTRLNFVDAFSNLITKDSYNISRFFSADYDKRLQEILQKEEFDVIHIESLFMTPYIDTIRRLTKTKVVMRSHNLEYKIWQRMARSSSNPPRRAYLRLLAKRLKEYELRLMNQVDGVIAISPDDEQNYGSHNLKRPIVTVPFGIDTREYKVRSRERISFDLFHLGAMDWMPNIEGMNWFIEKVWPGVLEEFPDKRLCLAGKASKKFKLPRSAKAIYSDGQVPDSKEYMSTKDVMIVPLLSGGGIRIKIIEGMALGKVIISTSIGSEGIGVTHDENILIADTPDEMRECLRRLHNESDLASRISQAARLFIEQNYDYAVLADRLVDFYRSLGANESLKMKTPQSEVVGN